LRGLFAIAELLVITSSMAEVTRWGRSVCHSFCHSVCLSAGLLQK